jgi:hypothetical protein
MQAKKCRKEKKSMNYSKNVEKSLELLKLILIFAVDSLNPQRGMRVKKC